MTRETILAKYGYRMQHLSTADLERMAKDVQRETNRRIDTLRRAGDYYTDTKAYKDIQATGGKIALSHNLKAGISGPEFVQSQTPQERRGYLMHEIRRGLVFMGAQTSSVSGWRDWNRSTIEGQIKAFNATESDPQARAEFERWVRKPGNQQIIGRAMRKYYNENAAVYLGKGSDIFVSSVFKIIMQQKDLKQGNKLDKLLEEIDKYILGI